MEQTKGQKVGGGASEGRAAEATSSETLSELEKTQKIPVAAPVETSESGGGASGASPLPPAEDSSRTGGGRADGSDTGGPM